MHISKFYSAAFLAATLISIQTPFAQSEENQYDDAQMWRFTVGAIHLHRDSGADVGIFSDGVGATQDTIVTNDDIGDLSSQGAVIGLRKDLGGIFFDIQGTFTADANSEWSSSNVALANGGAGAITSDRFLIGVALPNLALSAERTTSFHSIELNAGSYRQDNIELFTGLRAFWIDDDLTLTLNGAPGGFPNSTHEHETEVTNRLIGPQIGAKIKYDEFLHPSFGLTIGGKAGYLYNRANMKSGITLTNIGGFQSEVKVQDDFWTAMAELNVDASIKVTQNMNLEFGYNLLYLDNIGTSTKTLGTLSTAFLPYRGDVGQESALFHGFTAKAVWRW